MMAGLFQYAEAAGARYAGEISHGLAGSRYDSMEAAGVCWRRDGWLFSIYKRNGEKYPTLRVRRLKS